MEAWQSQMEAWMDTPYSTLDPGKLDREVQAYWRLVYPQVRRGESALVAKRGRSTFFYFNGAPHSLMPQPCEQHSWTLCRLDKFFGAGRTPPQVPHDALFAPFRAPAGSCMRSLFSWDARSNISAWEAAYPHAAGVPDHVYVS